MKKYKDLFLLDNEITYLNFGSFGACPKPIFQTYQDWQLKLERSPVHFIVDEAIQELEIVHPIISYYLISENISEPQFVICNAKNYSETSPGIVRKTTS